MIDMDSEQGFGYHFIMTAKTRKEAKRIGHKRYFTGNPCPNGHVADRFVSSGSCSECLREINNSAEKKDYFRERYRANREKIKEQTRKRYDKNRGRLLRQAKAWKENNPDRAAIIKKNYKMRRRAQENQGISSKELSEWVVQQTKQCYWCGARCGQDYHVDHYYPLSKGGQHERSNLVIACPSCNVRKSSKDPHEFARSLGRLL